MKEINVFGHDGSLLIHAHGETLLDTHEGTLIVHSESGGSTLTFNWDHVCVYTESPLLQEEED